MTTYDNRPKVSYYDCTSGGSQFCQGCYTMTEEQFGDYVSADDLFAAIAIQGIATFFARLQPAEFYYHPIDFDIYPNNGGIETLLSPLYANPVTPAAQVDTLRVATEYAHDLVVCLHRDHYADNTTFEPYDDLIGLLSQIDNMVCGWKEPTATSGNGGAE